MGKETKIEWCDSTVNFWRGCDKVSEGCRNCYITTTTPFRVSGQKHGDPRVKSESAVASALSLNRKPWICDNCGEAHAKIPNFCAKNKEPRMQECHGVSFHRRRIFSLSLGDWLDDEVPIEWLAEMLDTVRQCDQVTWILCSKRWEDFKARLNEVSKLWSQPKDYNAYVWGYEWYQGRQIPRNIIGLCSVENQEMADKRIPQFLTVPLACRGLSMEPLLGPVDLEKWLKIQRDYAVTKDFNGIDWLIVGGESGDNARPCNVDWIRDIARQGKAAGVATFVKQVGTRPVTTNNNSETDNWPPETIFHSDDHGQDGDGVVQVKLRNKKGSDPSEWPADLRVHQFPEV